MDMLPDRTAVGVFNIIFAILSIVANILVIIIILKKTELRNNGRYIPILGISIICLIDGGISNIFYSIHNFTGELYCRWMLTFQCLYLIYIGVIMYSLLLMYVNHLWHRSTTNRSKELKVGLIGEILVYIVLIILVGTVCATQTLNECYLSLVMEIMVILFVIVFYFPLICLLILGLVIICLHTTRNKPMGGTQPESNATIPVYLILAGIIVCACHGPTAVYYLASYGCTLTSCIGFLIITEVLSFLSMASSFLLPIAWLIDSEFRMGFSEVLCRRTTVQTSQQHQMVTPGMYGQAYNTYGQGYNSGQVVYQYYNTPGNNGQLLYNNGDMIQSYDTSTDQSKGSQSIP